MRLALIPAALALGFSLPPPAAAQTTPSDHFPAELAAARAMQGPGGFSAACTGEHLVYRVGHHSVTSGELCTEGMAPPALLRVRAFPGRQKLLLVLGACCGVVNTGAVLRLDEQAARPLRLIPMDSMEDFGAVTAIDRVAIVSGEITATGCGMIRYERALRLDWTRARIASDRRLRRLPVHC